MQDLTLITRKEKIPDASVSMSDVLSYMSKKTEDTITNFADGFATSGATLSRGANFKDIFTNPAGAFILTLAFVGVGVVTFIRVLNAIKKVREEKFKKLQELLRHENEKLDAEQIKKILEHINILRAKLKFPALKTPAQQKEYFTALNENKTIPQDKSKRNVTTAGTALTWFIPVFCVFGMILFTVDGGLTMNLLTQFFTSPIGISITVGSIAVGAGAGLIHRFFNSKFKALIRKRKLEAPEEYDANIIEFKRLTDNDSIPIKYRGAIHDAWNKITNHHFYTIQNKRTRSPAQVEMQKEFLVGLSTLINNGIPNHYNEFHKNYITDLHNTLPGTIDNNVELSEEEASDLSTDMNTLPKADRNSVLRSMLGFGVMWFLITLSLPGIDFTNLIALKALFATPPGWIILGVSLAAVVVAAIPKYFSKKRLKLKERRERVQRYLIEFEDRKDARNDIDLERWNQINTIEDIALRAQLQQKLLANQPVSDALIKQYKETNKPITPPIFNEKNKYELYHEGKLTTADKWSVARSAIGSYFNASIPVFCLAGLVLVNITAGLIGFGALLALVTTPVGWGLLAAAITVGVIFAIRKIYVRTKEKIQEREDRAIEEMEFNELEFKRLGSEPYQRMWNAITHSPDFNNPAKVELQKDFLQCIKYGQNKPEEFYENFKALEISQREKEKNKERIIPSFANNKYKYDAIHNKQLTTNEQLAVAKSTAGAFLTGLLPGVGLGALVCTIGVAASAFAIVWPIALGLIGAGIIGGGIYAVYRFIKQRETTIQERETNAETDIATNEAEFQKLNPDSTNKIYKKWQKIYTLEYSNAAKAEMQKDFLEGLKCVLANPEKYYDDFIKIAPGKKAHTPSATSRILSSLTREPELTQELDSSPLLLKPASHTPPKTTICQWFAAKLSMWKSSSETLEESTPLAQSQSRGPSLRASPTNSDLE